MRPLIENTFVHVVVRAATVVVPLTRYALARWLWLRLRQAFPNAIAAVLMPNHLHVLAPGNAEGARKRLGAMMSALRRSKLAGAENRWEPVVCRDVVSSPEKIARHVRYIALNPCRAGLARCPLAWLWSTYRDVMGAVMNPWAPPERVAAALAESPRGFRERHHRYVSGDPSVDVRGTPTPIPHDGDPSAYSQRGAMLAAVASTRGGFYDAQRKGPARSQLIALAKAAQWPASSLSAACSLRPQTIRSHLRRAGPIHPATLACLRDPRFTAYLQ